MRGCTVRRSATVVAAGSALALAPLAPVMGSGFALLEQSASRLGTAFSGTAALADDASTLFYNPAGLVALESGQVALVVSGVDIGSQFRDAASEAAFAQPLGGDGGDAGGWNAVPAAYVALPIGERMAIGFGANAPFGLKLEYTGDWAGRFQAVNSEIETLGLSAALAFEASDAVAFGLTLGYQRVQAELTNAVNYSAVVGQGVAQLVAAGQLPPAAVPGLLAANAGLGGGTRLRGDNDTFTYALGARFELTSQMTLGVAYRSKADYSIEGGARFAPPMATNPTGAAIIAAASSPGGALADGPVSVDLELPDIATVSLTHDLTDAITIMADVAWTGWSTVQELRVVRDSGAVLSVTEERWGDTWRYALGASFDVGDTWTLRAGIAHDETPVPDSTRTPRLPDAEREWLAVGARWKSGSSLTLDFGYAHLFSDDVPLDQNAGSTAVNGRLNGRQESAVNIVSAQLSYSF